MIGIKREMVMRKRPRLRQSRRAGPPRETELFRTAGTSAGVNIAPGSDDDGWTVTHPVILSDGTRLQLYKDGEALHAALNGIRAARRRIMLEVYIFASDDTGWAFADLLCHKARNGVGVFVIYDDFGSASSDQAMFDRMRRSGVRLEKFHPLRPWECRFSWRPVNRDHRKLLIIDEAAAGLGGLNVGGEYAGSWVVQSNSELWRDNAISVIGPGVKPLVKSFIQTWRYITGGGRVRRAELVHNLDGEAGDMGILASVPSMSGPLRPALTRLLRGACRDVLLTMAYFAPHDDLIDEICRAARRGVRVRLMLPGRCDIQLLITAARSFYETLMSAGVEIYERQGAILHAKSMVIDGQIAVLGSTNLDYRSIDYNFELSAIIRSPEFGRQMQELFEHDVRYARRIRLAEWRKRPHIDRVAQWIVNRARYLL